jgi:Protein of unknown function (DUF1631)
MSARSVPRGLMQFVDDELLRAPLLFDQVVDGTFERVRAAMPEMAPGQRTAIAELLESLVAQRARLAEYFTRSLREQVRAELTSGKRWAVTTSGMLPDASIRQKSLSLVDDAVVALDVELAHAIEAIKSVAEYELRELQTFTAALVGDMDVAADNNPLRPETYTRALWAAAQALPLSRGHQVAFMRHAGTPLAQVLRKSYAAASSRLESMGVEPAAYRTLILPAGSRRGSRPFETTFSPDLHQIRDSMPAPLDPLPTSAMRYDGQTARATTNTLPATESWREVARSAASHVDRQTIELVSRLFETMVADERVPPDVGFLISRLQGPALRLTLHDGSLLDQDKHELWRFIDRLVFEAEMTPDRADPDRIQWLAAAQGTIDRLSSEPEQSNGLYRWALDRLDRFLEKRLARRLSAAASQIGALQKLEDKLCSDGTTPTSLHGTLDVPQLDTVPADLLEAVGPPASPTASDQAWLDSLRPGDRVRMFLQGRWVQARLLWPGERREIWLFADGASDNTWAVRRAALLTMKAEHLVKTIKQRSIVGSAVATLQEALAGAAAA